MGVASVVILDTHGLDAAAAAYGTLLGAPSVQSDGPCQWQVGSTRLVVRGGDGGPRVLVPAIDLVDPQSADVFVGAGALLARRARAVVPAEPIAGARTAVVDGLPVGIVDTAGLAPVDPDRSGDIVGLDHIVMSSGSRDEALALFGAVLDFDFRLEQNLSLGDRGRVHQLFLRGRRDDCRGPGRRHGRTRHHTVGLAWTSRDIEASHTRLAEAGADLSEIRKGHKPGTRLHRSRRCGRRPDDRHRPRGNPAGVSG